MKAPKSWSEITLNQYYNLLDVLDLPLSNEDKAIAMLSALTDIPIETLTNDIPAKELAVAISGLKFIEITETKGTAKAFFKLKGRSFDFDLILKDSNASSFISLSENTKTPEISNKNIHNVLAIFCHETNFFGFRKKRTVNSQKEIAEFLKNNMNMNDAFLYSSFFLSSRKSLLKSTLDYLDKTNKKILKDLKKEMKTPHS